jgi:hypothetical protein
VCVRGRGRERGVKLVGTGRTRAVRGRGRGRCAFAHRRTARVLAGIGGRAREGGSGLRPFDNAGVQEGRRQGEEFGWRVFSRGVGLKN